MNFVQKTTNLNKVLKGTSYVSSYPLTPSLLVIQEKQFPLDNAKYYLNVNSLYSALPSGTGIFRAVQGVTVKAQYRYVHTDVDLPSYKNLRRTSTIEPTIPAKETNEKRKAFTYLSTVGTLMCGTLAAKFGIVKVVKYLDWNQDVAALGTSEINIGTIPEGKSITFKWQGKPLFIKHRTPVEIDAVRTVPIESLRDPQSDESRCKKKEWLVCLGVCTHLGCVPLHNKGENVGGFFCPCHGSHYDASGRVTNGPAPQNLEIPSYFFKDENTIVVG